MKNRIKLISIIAIIFIVFVILLTLKGKLHHQDIEISENNNNNLNVNLNNIIKSNKPSSSFLSSVKNKNTTLSSGSSSKKILGNNININKIYICII